MIFKGIFFCPMVITAADLVGPQATNGSNISTGENFTSFQIPTLPNEYQTTTINFLRRCTKACFNEVNICPIYLVEVFFFFFFSNLVEVSYKRLEYIPSPNPLTFLVNLQSLSILHSMLSFVQNPNHLTSFSFYFLFFKQKKDF